MLYPKGTSSDLLRFRHVTDYPAWSVSIRVVDNIKVSLYEKGISSYVYLFCLGVWNYFLVLW